MLEVERHYSRSSSFRGLKKFEKRLSVHMRRAKYGSIELQGEEECCGPAVRRRYGTAAFDIRLSTWTKFIDTSRQSLFAARHRSKAGGNSIGPRARTAYIASIGSPPWRGRRECASSEADFSHEDKRQALPDDLAGERWAFG
jgi:hypothetical protein